LGLGIDGPDGHAQLGPGLKDAHPGDPKRQVLLVGGVDELVEGRIFECLPPVFVVCRRGLDSLVTGIRPGLLHLDRRTHVVGPYHGAAQDQHGQAGDHPNQPAHPDSAGLIVHRFCSRWQNLAVISSLAPKAFCRRQTFAYRTLTGRPPR